MKLKREDIQSQALHSQSGKTIISLGGRRFTAKWVEKLRDCPIRKPNRQEPDSSELGKILLMVLANKVGYRLRA